MKISIKKDVLIKGLNIVERVTVKNPTLPILNNIIIKTEPSGLSLIATDLELGLSVLLPAKTEGGEEIAIQPKILNGFLQNIQDENLTFKILNNTIKLENTQYKTSFKGEDAKEYPLLPKITKKDSVTIPAQIFIQGLQQVINSVSTSDIKPELTGVLVFIQKKELKLTSTDSFRLAEKVIKTTTEQQKEKKLIIPAKTAQEIIRVYQNTKRDLQLSYDINQIEIEGEKDTTPNIRLISKVIEGEYPEYTQIIPQNFSTKTITTKNNLLQQIKAASLFASKLQDVTLRITSEKIEVHSNNPDVGDFNSFIDAATEGDGGDFVLNYHYLADGLQNLEGDECVIKLNQKEKPLLIESVSYKNYFYLLMPIRN